MLTLMYQGVCRFNFTISSSDLTVDEIKQSILRQLTLVPAIDIAPNTVSLQLDLPRRDEAPPPLPGFHQIRGSIRRR